MRKVLLSAVAVATLGISASGADFSVQDLVKAKKQKEIEIQQKQEMQLLQKQERDEAYKMKNEKINDTRAALLENEKILFTTSKAEIEIVLKSVLNDKERFIENAYIIDYFLKNKDAVGLSQFLGYKIAYDTKGTPLFEEFSKILNKRIETLNSNVKYDEHKVGMMFGVVYDGISDKKSAAAEADANKGESKIYISSKAKDEADAKKAKEREEMQKNIPYGGQLFLRTEMMGSKKLFKTFEVEDFSDGDFVKARKIIAEVKALVPDEFEAVKNKKVKDVFNMTLQSIWEKKESYTYPFENLFNYDMWRIDVVRNCVDSGASFWGNGLDSDKINGCLKDEMKKNDLELNFVDAPKGINQNTGLGDYFFTLKHLTVSEMLKLKSNETMKKAGFEKLEREKYKVTADYWKGIEIWNKRCAAGICTDEIDKKQYINPSWTKKPITIDDLADAYRVEKPLIQRILEQGQKKR